jgi:glutathione S-transferase
MRARMVIALADISCELREVKLSNKPKHMLEVSPKGTVPVLIYKGKIIDESIEIINWVLEQNNVFIKISSEQEMLTEYLIDIFDNKFKENLDKYKYSTRYKNINKLVHREECLKILRKIEDQIIGEWFFGNTVNKIDICIFPFIRQYRIADPEWFDSLIDIPKVQNLLNKFLNYKIFKIAMKKYTIWDEDSNPVYFPKAL